MAATVTCSMSLEYSKTGTISEVSRSNEFSITPSGQRYQIGAQNIDTSPEAVDIGDVAAGGTLYVKNLGPTNYVQLQVASDGDPFARLAVGQSACFPVDSGATIYAVAHTAAVDIEIAYAPA